MRANSLIPVRFSIEIGYIIIRLVNSLETLDDPCRSLEIFCANKNNSPLTLNDSTYCFRNLYKPSYFINLKKSRFLLRVLLYPIWTL